MNKIQNLKSILIVLTIMCCTLYIVSCTEKEKDTVAPTIFLKGDNPFYLDFDSTFVEPGYIASDNVDGDISSKVMVSGIINNKVEGTYFLNYTVSDAEGNSSSPIKREIRVMKFK